MYVGGRDQTFVGWGTVQSNWRDGTKEWKGQKFLYTVDHLFREPVSGTDVLASTGFELPRLEKVVEESLSTAVWRAARGKPLTQTDRAVEGILTESRSRSRNAGLRLSALQRAGGVCEGCDVNFTKKHGGLGRHCLVVHHKKQLKDTDQPVETKLSDLAVVCANCHMMIHSNRDRALTLAHLRKSLKR
jgi:5-methylcytosine-specific restriction protein A